MLPPTSSLPGIKTLRTLAPNILQEGVDYLRNIYSPPVRGSQRRRSPETSRLHDKFPDEIQAIREDGFERNYAIKWLTTLISQLGYDGAEDAPVEQKTAQETLIESAASLLALCAGTAAAGTILRTFVFEGEYPLFSPLSTFKIHLKDIPLDNQDYGSVGAQTWGGACILAEMIVEAPVAFGLLDPISFTPFRCLELGAGTGLVSIVVGKVLERKMETLASELLQDLGRVEVVATDYYPSVLINLETNIKANFSPSRFPNVFQIGIQALDWSKFPSSDSIPNALQEPFDVAYGADIVYEEKHADWIKGCLTRLLKKPNHMHPNPLFHLIIPLRHTHTAECSTIERVFGREKVQESTGRQKDDTWKLVILFNETIVCDAQSSNENDQVEYAYYRIGWQT